MTSPSITPAQPRALRLLIALLTALLLPVGLTGASLATPAHHPHHHHTTWSVLVGNESKDKAIQGMRYLPSNIWIKRGDAVRWNANAAEIHTVTFLAAGQKLTPFNPGDPKQTTPQGGRVYDGKSYYNSGVLGNDGSPGFGLTIRRDYRLSFPRTGNFTYYCLVHGAMMKGTVHVLGQHSRLPFTQAQYDRQAAKQGAAVLASGFRLWKHTARLATNHLVFEGNDNGVAMVTRFIRPTVTIRAGQKVVFKNIGMNAPHTVTFGKEPADITKPLGDPRHYRGGDLSSGIQTPGSHFTVRFVKPGVYHYICALHDYMGMVGKVIVVKGHHH